MVTDPAWKKGGRVFVIETANRYRAGAGKVPTRYRVGDVVYVGAKYAYVKLRDSHREFRVGKRDVCSSCSLTIMRLYRSVEEAETARYGAALDAEVGMAIRNTASVGFNLSRLTTKTKLAILEDLGVSSPPPRPDLTQVFLGNPNV